MVTVTDPGNRVTAFFYTKPEVVLSMASKTV